MLDMLKERKAALEAQGQKGFTLMEMLIVIAIIAILIAIAIPIFTSQLENARDSTSAANLRSAYAEASAAKLTETSDGNATVNDDGTVTVTNVHIEDTNGDIGNYQNDLPFTLSGTISNGDKTVIFTFADNGTVTGAIQGS